TIDHKEYEAKMQKLMDNYIASEDVIRITNPVDILDEKGFEEELERLGTPRAKADAIRTRMSKSISTKWDENPAYYKKFSQRIEEVLQAYKDKRISEREYFNKMKDIKKDYSKGHSGVEYPETIKYNSNAKAFYGITSEIIHEGKEPYGSEELNAELALKIENIVHEYVKVDWHDNTDIHDKIAQEIDDLIYDYSKEYALELSFDEIDKIIDGVKKVALKRY